MTFLYFYLNLFRVLMTETGERIKLYNTYSNTTIIQTSFTGFITKNTYRNTTIIQTSFAGFITKTNGSNYK